MSDKSYKAFSFYILFDGILRLAAGHGEVPGNSGISDSGRLVGAWPGSFTIVA